MSFWDDLTGKTAADAAGKAAEASAAEARRQFDITQEGVREATGYAKDAVTMAQSPEELAALKKSLGLQEQELGKQIKLFEALDPAILEASQQALKLLRGEEAKALDPLRKQRDRQREKLMNRLRETLGPGAETSTAGIQALTQFDQQTDDLLFGAQQQSMGQLFGMGQSGAMNRSAVNQGIGQIANIGGMFGNAAGRVSNAQMNLANTRLGGVNALTQSGQNMINTAGSQFVGEQLRGQGLQSLYGNLITAGATAGFGALFKSPSSNSDKVSKQG